MKYKNKILILLGFLIFLSAGCQDSEITPEEQETLNIELLKAVKHEKYSESRKLIKKGADINMRNYMGRTPLFIAAYRKYSSKFMQMLIDNGADVTIVDYEGSSVWFHVKHNDKLSGSDLYKFVKDKSSEIIKTEHIEVYKFLEDLHMGGGMYTVVNYLQEGGDVNAIRKSGFYLLTPIIVASGGSRKPEVVQALLDAGAIVTPIDETGWTPLMAAAKNQQHPEIFKMLLDAGCDVNGRETEGQMTPILIAAKNNNASPEVLSVLISAGADINAVDNEGRSSLMFVVFNQHDTVCMEMLLDAGADVSLVDNDGRSAWDYMNLNYHLYELKDTSFYKRLKDMSEK